MGILSIAELLLAVYGGATLIHYTSKSIRKKIPQNKIAKISLYGDITNYDSDLSIGEKITPNSVEALVEKASENNVKGIIFEIDSHGGPVIPSKEIGDYVKEIKVPTVALVKGCAASGAYWIASSCDKIVANPFSTVGSIGVTLSHIEISKLAEKLGIKYDGLYSGKYKDMGNLFRPFTDEERKILQEEMEFTHEKFIQEVAKNRGMEVDEVRELAEGLAYNGERALKLGLVDKLGNLKEAQELIEEAGSFKDSKIVEYRHEKNGLLAKLNTFAEGMGRSFAGGIYNSISHNKPELR